MSKDLGAGRPLISVVLPTRNGATTIDAQLEAMARQTMTEPWELVVVDNGSTDDTRERVCAWKPRIPELRLVEGPPAGSKAVALNTGVALARGDRLAFCDHDDVVSDGWVEAMCQALASHGHVTGPTELGRLNPPELVWGDHVAAWLTGPPFVNFRPFAMGANAGWRREVFEALGGADPQAKECDDSDLSWRAQLTGHELHFSADALVHRRMRTTASAAFRQHLAYGRSETRMNTRFAWAGARPRPAREQAWDWVQLIARLPWLLSRRHRMRWAETAGLLVGRALPLSKSDRRWLADCRGRPLAG